jgi:glc operon protein GlcG
MSLFQIALVLIGSVATLPAVPAQEKKPPLVTRDRVQLNLAGAETVLEAAKKKAAALGLKCNIAVVDDGGHLLAFARMDGARPASAATALTKAASAATFRQETGPLPAKGEPDVLLSLSIQTASGGKITALKGGVPIVVDAQVVGAIGVGGGTGEQDVEVAKAGLQALLDERGQKK